MVSDNNSLAHRQAGGARGGPSGHVRADGVREEGRRRRERGREGEGEGKGEGGGSYFVRESRLGFFIFIGVEGLGVI